MKNEIVQIPTQGRRVGAVVVEKRLRCTVDVQWRRGRLVVSIGPDRAPNRTATRWQVVETAIRAGFEDQSIEPALVKGAKPPALLPAWFYGPELQPEFPTLGAWRRWYQRNAEGVRRLLMRAAEEWRPRAD